MTRFAKAAFDGLGEAELQSMCSDLAAYLSKRVSDGEFHSAVYSVVEELRDAGHDLWSQDEGDDLQIWGPNYESPSGPGLVISFSAPDEVTVEPVPS